MGPQTMIATALIGCAISLMLWFNWRDPLAPVLTLAFILATAMGEVLTDPDRTVGLALIDYGIVLAAGGIWARTCSMRAYAVGFVGLAKLGLRLWHTNNSYMDHYTYAVLLNGLFVLQVTMAGGLIDDLGKRLDHLFHGLFPRRWRLLRNVER